MSQTARMGDRLHELLTEWSSQTAAKAGMPEGTLAEGFRVISAG